MRNNSKGKQKKYWARQLKKKPIPFWGNEGWSCFAFFPVSYSVWGVKVIESLCLVSLNRVAQKGLFEGLVSPSLSHQGMLATISVLGWIHASVLHMRAWQHGACRSHLHVSPTSWTHGPPGCMFPHSSGTLQVLV
jgi:hypothetical protein